MVSVAETLQAAVQEHQTGNLDGAEQLYQKVLEFLPQQPDAIHLLGVIAHQRGDHPKAVKLINKAIELSPNNAAFHNNLGEAYRCMSKLNEASKCYRNALSIEPSHVGARVNSGSVLHDLGETEAAVKQYEEALLGDPDCADAFNNMGIIHREEGRLGEAERCFAKALELNPGFSAAHNNLGNVYRDREELGKALECYGRAIMLTPGFAEAYKNRGDVVLRQGDLEEADQSYKHAIGLRPEFPEAYNGLGNVQQLRGDFESAVKSHQEALRSRPDFADALNDLGNALFKRGEYLQAQESYSKAIQASKECIEAYNNLGTLLEDQGRHKESADAFRCAIQLKPGNKLWDLRLAAKCPTVFGSAAEIAEYRARLESELSRFQEMDLKLSVAELGASGASPSFNLQFIDGNIRPIKEAHAAVFRNIPAYEPLRNRLGKPRVGIVVTMSHERIFIKSLKGVLNRINTTQFDICIVCAPSGSARIRQGINNESISILPIPGTFERVANTIRNSRFDVLYFWEVGNDSTNYFLPFLRLAPVQCTSWGIQVTTGIPRMDYYLSSDLVESKTADQHYSENLLRANTLLTYQTRVEVPQNQKSRSDFGFSSSQHLYVCAQQVGKFHPDFDEVIGEILRRDTHGQLVITKDKFGYGAERLKQRFQRHIPDVVSRIKFLPQQQFSDYISLLLMADVLLDPIHFGGVNSTYDGISLNKPIVTLPSEFHRGRYTLACYKKMGMDKCVAVDSTDYVQIATSLATNPDYREDVCSSIAEASDAVFEDKMAVHEHERLFEFLINEPVKS